MARSLEKRRDTFTSNFPSFASFFPDLKSWSVGFDREWDMLEDLQDSFARQFPAYPPYNIKKIKEGRYEIEMAVAGFTKDDLSVEIKDNQIVITGDKEVKDESSDVDYIYKGIASRHFKQSFALADHLEVTGSEFKDGILKIALEGEVKNNGKSKKIKIV